MANELKLNAPDGLTVGRSVQLNVVDASNNATFASLAVSGTSTLSATSATSLSVSGAATFSTSPTSPTPAVDNNSTQLATTAWYQNQKANAVPLVDGTAAIGTSLRWAAQNHVHPTDTSRLSVSNPTATGALTVTGGTVTSDTPVLNITQTWNSAGVIFNAIKLLVTDTASAEGSKPLDLTIGSNKFGIDKNATIVQFLATLNIARDIVGVAGSRHIREYQDLNDYNVTQGIGGATTNTENIEWGYTWNAKWDVGTSSYVKDRSNANDHALMSRSDKKYRQQWWFSDGTSVSSPISWVKKIDFDFPNNTYTFNGVLNTPTLNVSGNIETGTWNASTISILKGGTGRTTIGSANQFSSVNAAGTAIEYKTFTSSDNSLAIDLATPGIIDLKLVGTLPGNINFAGDLTVGGAVPNYKFFVQASTGNTDVKGTLAIAGAASLANSLSVTGDFAIGTNKLTVASASGNTSIAGTLNVISSTALNGTLTVTSSTSLSNTLNVAGDVAINTNKFNVTALNGNTSIAGTLNVVGALTVSNALNVTSDVAINTNKFNVTALNGNTSIAGTLNVVGSTTISNSLNVSTTLTTNALSVTTNSTLSGTLSVSGKTTVADIGVGSLALNDGTSEVTLSDAYSINVAATGTSTLATVTNTYKAAEFTVKAFVPTAGAYQLIKILAVCDGASTTAITEYGNVEIGDTGVSYDVTAVGGVMSLVATTTISNSSFVVVVNAIK